VTIHLRVVACSDVPGQHAIPNQAVSLCWSVAIAYVDTSRACLQGFTVCVEAGQATVCCLQMDGSHGTRSTPTAYRRGDTLYIQG
jgi:hypothetical protein